MKMQYDTNEEFIEGAYAVAEEIRRHHQRLAFSDLQASHGYTKTYESSKQLFIAACEAVLRAEGVDSRLEGRMVYEIWVDNSEPVRYCVQWLKSHPQEFNITL